jgi:two-component system LytT family response regulator
MIKTIIIDDEAKLREVLRIKLEQCCPEIDILDLAHNAEDAYNKIKLHEPQLIFLDINMPGETGFELLNRFQKINFEIIFATGYNEYALDALKVSAVDYVLKPIKNEDLIAAVNKAVIRIKDREKIEKYDVLKHNINNLGNQSAKVAIPGSSSIDFVTISEIIRCEGWNKYTKIHLKDQNVIVSSYNIGVFKDMFKPYDFYSTHKSHIVNKRYIKKYIKEGSLIMIDNSEVPLARRRKEEFTEHILKTLKL